MEDNNLAETRRKKGYSQFDLAKAANITQSIISDIELGKRYAYPGWRKRLAEALGVPEEQIFPVAGKEV